MLYSVAKGNLLGLFILTHVSLEEIFARLGHWVGILHNFSSRMVIVRLATFSQQAFLYNGGH
jgi:hypothetical protein